MQTLYGRRLFLEDQAVEAAPATFHDLANMINMRWYFDDDQEYRVCPDEQAMAPSTDRLLWVGDSFQVALEPILTALFAQVTIVHREKFDARMLDKDPPDIVVLQYVERSLDLMPEEEHIWQAEACLDLDE